MKAVVTGAGGQLGRELGRCAPPAIELRGVPREDLDLRDQGAVERAFADWRADVIVNAAAYTAVDRAEEEPELAFAVNAEGAGRLAAAAQRYGARLIHVSTDFVFAGDRARPYRPEDEPGPLSVYGRSKREGEIRVLKATGGDALVLRSAWIYSRFGSNFVLGMLSRMRTGKELGVVADQIGAPTWARGLARAIWRAVERPAVRGIRHWTDAGVASWFDLAVAVQEEAIGLGLLERPVPVRPLRTEDWPTPARRPAYSVLDCRATWRELEVEPRHWRAALREMLADLREIPGD